MNNLFLAVVVSVFFTTSVFANECRMKIVNTFTHNLLSVDGFASTITGEDLTYKSEVQEIVSSKEGYVIVPNTITVKERRTIQTGGCDAGWDEREVNVEKDNPNYDYKIVVSQDFKYKEPTNDLYVQKKSDKYDVSLLPNYTFKTSISLLNTSEQPVDVNGKKLSIGITENAINVQTADLPTKVTTSINNSHQMIMSQLNALPNCDQLRKE